MDQHPHGHAPETNDGPQTIMDRLKTETWPLHQRAETAPQQKALVKGEMPKAEFIEHLGQLYLLHDALETKLREAVESEPAIKAVVKDYQFQVPYLLEDFAFFGIEAGSFSPTAHTQAMIDRIEKAANEAPLKLLGMQYVLEGSNNGGRFIAMAVRKTYELKPGKGDRYLDPYGEAQRGKWAEFKADMLAQTFTPEQEGLLLSGANELFLGMVEMGGGEVSAEELAAV
ncbi:MAG: biliverdin-producing heme oxygenase [Planctomycetota bacterium]